MRCGEEGCRRQWTHLTKVGVAEVGGMHLFAWWGGKERIAGKRL